MIDKTPSKYDSMKWPMLMVIFLYILLMVDRVATTYERTHGFDDGDKTEDARP